MPFHRCLRMKNLDRDVILTCHFLATTLMWWSFLVPSWVEIELPGDPNILVSLPFEDCSSQTCWLPKHKPTYFILGGVLMISSLLSLSFNSLLLTFPQLFPETQKQYVSCAFIFIVTSTFVLLSLLMYYMQILETSQGPDPPKVTYKFPYFMNVSSSALFLLSGALCLHNSQHVGAVGVLKSRTCHVNTPISLEDTKLSLKPSRRRERNAEDSPPVTGDFSAIRPKDSVADSGKN